MARYLLPSHISRLSFSNRPQDHFRHNGHQYAETEAHQRPDDDIPGGHFVGAVLHFAVAENGFGGDEKSDAAGNSIPDW